MLDNNTRVNEPASSNEAVDQTRSDLSPDTAFHLVANARRRYVLYYFTARSTAVATVETLTGYVTTHTDTADRKHVEIDLVHQHLPMLADNGIVEYDTRSEQVRYYGASLVEKLLELVAEDDLEP
ncbi:hypothetical protein ACLI4Z_13165 [Natrialbaceae archaeon A-arb3/5]